MSSIGSGSRAAPRVLLVEDHLALAQTVCLFLENAGFVIDYSAEGATGLHLARTNRYDVIILDVMLPGLSGLDVCERLRKDVGITVPILMLTARDSLEDKLKGFEAGADDYLVKPFDLPELQARLLAMTRRQSGALDQKPIEIGELRIDVRAQSVSRAGAALKLTPTGYRILLTLARQTPGFIAKENLEQEIWGDALPDSDTLRSHLYQLRQVVDKPFDTPMIETRQGFGIRLIQPDSD
ncbi:MAG: DNA-binding response regulator [unclassified Hahellaceae]|nr:DNA-binding response regulator [Hahellaceae bacterium]|tara:strand:- start:22848 stop:23564 length:717 start_codon:yes stop_codon:yes gene_type:complete